ncbi:hypothetical protein MPL1032_180040 [Mesorhizobium plurifarium]|uniref:Uncharacterized protein n=1 Tax=Mesorhizobium plurifarium TaxID=69974 RepID=A0A0K2VU45_MESPL|nr:hypothetical protein MPL1032_180040 [Mesorhizobium plurifarium]
MLANAKQRKKPARISDYDVSNLWGNVCAPHIICSRFCYMSLHANTGSRCECFLLPPTRKLVNTYLIRIC